MNIITIAGRIGREPELRHTIATRRGALEAV